MDLRNLASNRVQCAELLEGRRLLSVVAPSVEARSAVEVVELVAAEEEEDDDVLVEPSDIPARIMAAFEAAYPDALILEAELEEEEDGQFEYDINAQFNEAEIEVSLTPEGEITETSRILTESQLPRAVLDWLAANFAGAEVDEIELVDEGGVQSYELHIAPAEGAMMEATLRLPDVQPSATPEQAALAASSAEPFATDTTKDGADANDGQGVLTEPVRPTERGKALVTLTDAELVGRARSAEAAREDTAEDPAALGELITSRLVDDAGRPSTDAAGMLIALGQPGMMLPELANMLDHRFSVNAAALEREVRLILAQIDRLGSSLIGSRSDGSGALRLALVAALIAGAQLLRPDPRAPRGGQVLAANAVDRNSTWILWASVTNRR